VFALPKGLDPSQSAPLMCAGISTFAPLKRNAVKGETCSVIGIGGLGHLAI